MSAAMFWSILVASGCPRLVTVGNSQAPAPRSLGEDCAAGSECTSGSCAQGVCCNGGCEGEDLSCALPGSLGTCSQKHQAAACERDEHCPTAAPHCVDRVCCDSVCGEACHSCINEDHVGFCTLNADNTDPRHECGGGDACVSCSQGFCLPSSPDTDPERECAAGLACNGLGACAQLVGTACTSDLECSHGACVAGKCRTRFIEVVDPTSLFPGLNDLRPVAAAVDANGRASVMIRTRRQQWDVDGFRGQVGPWLMLSDDGTAWRSTLVDTCSYLGDSVALSRVGLLTTLLMGRPSSRFESAGPSATCAEGPPIGWEGMVVHPTSGIFARATLTGPAEGEEESWGGALAVGAGGTSHTAVADQDGVLWFGSRSGDDGSWTMKRLEVQQISQGFVTLMNLQDTWVIIDLVEIPSGVGVRATVLRDGAPEESIVEFPASTAPLESCTYVDGIHASPLTGTRRAFLTFSCDTDLGTSTWPPGVGFFDLDAPVAERWTPLKMVQPGGSETSFRAYVEGAASLADGTPALVYIDMNRDVRIAFPRGDGWDSFALLAFGYGEASSLNVANIIAVSSPAGLHVFWTQFTQDSPEQVDVPLWVSSIAHAVVRP